MDINVQSFAAHNLRRRPEPVEVGGFVAGFDPSTTDRNLNYATPLPGARPTDRDVADLVEAFRARGLVPRLEFAPDGAPAVEPALRRAGFTTEAVHPYMVCTPATLVTPAGFRVPSADHPPVHVAVPRTDDDFAAIDAALSEAYGAEIPPASVTNASATNAGAARLRRIEAGGGAVRFVRAPDGSCAGAATCSAPAAGTAELAGVGTRPAYRGRGIAAAVTASLSETLFARGAGSVWLEYEGEDARRIYERVGFRPHGTRLYMALENSEHPAP
ncbi:GNAT family N-acetyltransferase [Streptomyces sp. NBC_00237]|uniref:GNAT family N-acetyltransferase n=1 Tax=Streptomyces sp. NBC_00237 TaxID=2975687 RepID=UPI0022572D6C|nr:GNAT family N-acetyltransferase [Streptomyces sp. NBC_00237]MCX5206437.1 GNAT family N-acetyltransferase [Streptomyces sp. NBC_00237]